MEWIVLLEWLAKIIGALGTGAGVLIAAVNYRSQTRIKRAEWVKSLFEKFFETPTYKEVRGWLDYNELAGKLSVSNEVEQRANEEKFTDFLNFFEFIGVLYSRGQITLREVDDIFDYYLKRIKDDPNCQAWIEKYGFEKLKALVSEL